MSQFDKIASSFRIAWQSKGYTGICPVANIYMDRAQQPIGLDGFPYMTFSITDEGSEVATTGVSIVSYRFAVQAWTVQGQTGGSSVDDPVTDASNLQRALEATLTIPPNATWGTVTGFLHCISQGGGTLRKDNQLYLGRDVWTCVSNWRILVQE